MKCLPQQIGCVAKNVNILPKIEFKLILLAFVVLISLKNIKL